MRRELDHRHDCSHTGIGLAFACAIRGYRLVLTMPESMSAERVALLRHFGADVVLTPGILITNAVVEARTLVGETPGAIMLDQFSNPADVLERSDIDEVIAVSDEDAFVAARKLASVEGILAGVSSGAAFHAALAVASRPESQGASIVVLLADTAERYISSALFVK